MLFYIHVFVSVHATYSMCVQCVLGPSNERVWLKDLSVFSVAQYFFFSLTRYFVFSLWLCLICVAAFKCILESNFFNCAHVYLKINLRLTRECSNEIFFKKALSHGYII